MDLGVIPLRAGSKGIPGKNKRMLVGRPLFSWALYEAAQSALDAVIVYSDDAQILETVRRDYAWCGKVKARPRPAHTATDGASTESALTELAKELAYGFDTLTLLQATSPLTRSGDIDKALKAVKEGGFDSALSVVRGKRFHWSEGGAPEDYDPAARPRRQDYPGQLVENGAVYVTGREAFRKSGVRISGKIACVEMGGETLTEIDEREDWPVIEALAESRLRSQKSGAPEPVRALVLDVDGVFTDGRAGVGPEGERHKDFSLVDGMGVELARQEGIEIIVLTGEDSPIVASRMSKLGIERYYPGIRDKYARLGAVLKDMGLSRRDAAYLGDDVNDMACMLSCGISLCPADAQAEARRAADWPLTRAGGRGAVREACETLIKHNRRWR